MLEEELRDELASWARSADRLPLPDIARCLRPRSAGRSLIDFSAAIWSRAGFSGVAPVFSIPASSMQALKKSPISVLTTLRFAEVFAVS